MHHDFLFIIAEIGAAFAGFTGLVVALSMRDDQSEIALGTLQNVLTLSLLTVAFALLPSLLARLGVEPTIAWRVSAAAFAAVLGTYAARFIPNAVSGYWTGGQRVPWSFRLNIGVTIVIVVVLALCAIAILPSLSYLASLFGLLYLAGFAFLRAFVSIRRGSPAA